MKLIPFPPPSSPPPLIFSSSCCCRTISSSCISFRSLFSSHILPIAVTTSTIFFSRRRIPTMNYAAAITPITQTSASAALTTATKTTTAAAIDTRRSQLHRHRRREKLIVILGATGCGKSRLSIDLASRFPSEIINSDKMQVYRGLDITTNKIPLRDRFGVPHHLLGDFDSSLGDFTPTQYRSKASAAVNGIISRRNIPLVVGGSNSLVYALLADRFSTGSDVFRGSDPVLADFRYRCCFLWVDVSVPVLNQYLEKRVDEMLDSGMLDELARYYESEIEESEPGTGLRKAIGVPEFERYFRMFTGGEGRARGTRCAGRGGDEDQDDGVRRAVYEEAVRAIKDNTTLLAKRQVEKILRLKSGGWDLKRLDATAAFSGALDGGSKQSEIWERQVVEASVKIVKRFLEEEEE
ncbi:hypothetical protein Dimus_014695 [Dionaea muscipula]